MKNSEQTDTQIHRQMLIFLNFSLPFSLVVLPEVVGGASVLTLVPKHLDSFLTISRSPIPRSASPVHNRWLNLAYFGIFHEKICLF